MTESVMKKREERKVVKKSIKKKGAIIAGLTVALVMTACTTAKGLPNNGSMQSGTSEGNSNEVSSNLINPNVVIINSSEGSQVEENLLEQLRQSVNYDIEIAFDDPVFIRIMEGEVTPVEVCHGLGGEGGYTQDKSNDPEVISAYIEAFRNLRIEEVITDKEDFNYVADGINDYIFTFEDGSDVLISMDLSSYVIRDDKQYVFEYSRELHDLNEQIGE